MLLRIEHNDRCFYSESYKLKSAEHSIIKMLFLVAVIFVIINVIILSA